MQSGPTSRQAGREHDQLRSDVIRIAWPASIEYLVITSIVFADIIFLSRLSSEAIAGVGVSITLIFVFVAIYNSVAVATTTIVAQAKGAGNQTLGMRAAAQSILLALVLGMIAAFAGATISKPAMTLMGLTGDAHQAGSTYLSTILLASPVYAIALVGGGVLRGVGDTRTPMQFTLTANATKICLSAILIFGLLGFPALRVKGAALATVVAYGLNALLISTKLIRGFDGMDLSGFTLFRPDFALLKRIIHLSLPVAGEQTVMRTGFVFYMRVVSALGTIALAANQIALRLESVALTIGFGFSVAATTLVGQAIGKGEVEEAQNRTRVTARLSFLTMSIVALGLLIMRKWAIGIFKPEPEVGTLALTCLTIGVFELPAFGLLFSFAGSLRGAGDTRSPMIVALVGTFLFRLPLVYLLAIELGLGLRGVWYGTLLDWIGRTILIYLIYRMGTWKAKAFITAHDKAENSGQGNHQGGQHEESDCNCQKWQV